METAATTWSPSRSLIPRTPWVLRPMLLRSASAKRIPIPSRVKISMSLAPLVGRTETTSSSPISLIATSVWFRESYSLNSVFLATP